MPNLSLRTIANHCGLIFPLSVRQDVVNTLPNRLKEHLVALQGECMPWEVVAHDSGHMAIHAALVETGEIVYFGGWFQSSGFYRFDVRSEAISTEFEQGPDPAAPLVPDTDLFCSGHAFLADGRLLVVGGELPTPSEGEDLHGHGGMSGGGERACWVYRPSSRTWTQVADLNLDPHGDLFSGGRWYPGVATLFDNQVLAVGGHPDVREFFTNPDHRHNNNTPERYSPRLDTWTLMTAETTADNEDRDEYQRLFLMPDGRVFFATIVKGFNSFFDPYQGTFHHQIGPPSDGIYFQGSNGTAVILPLLPGDGYRPRVLVCNAVQPQRIDLGDLDDSAQWENAGTRNDTDWPEFDPVPVRHHACSVLLPDGTVFVSGGTNTDSTDDAVRQAAAVRSGEIYDPAIDWEAGAYDEGSQGQWTRVQTATVERHYHSVALLMPNGTVWTAGSNGPGGVANQERRIEVYRPAYCAQLGRPDITTSPDRIVYGGSFEVRTPQAADIRRVALIRNGSVTHAFNYDQRYIALQFSRAGGDRLTVAAPAHSALAPPGNYMLWIVDDAGRPCKRANFMNVSAFSVRITAAACGVTAPLSLLQDVFTVGASQTISLRQQIHVMQRECLF